MREHPPPNGDEVTPVAGAGVVVAAAAVCAIALACAGGMRVDPNRTQPPGASRIRIDLNTARQATLELLPGVGPSLAGRIVRERETSGRFQSVQGLSRVHGIGPITVARLEQWAKTDTKPLHNVR